MYHIDNKQKILNLMAVTQITPDNLKQVFDKWVVMIGREINGVNEEHYALLFFADIMHGNDGQFVLML